MEEGFVLSATTIDIWQISISQSTRDLGWYKELLSGEEISRSLRFYFQRDRERFIVTHGVMRFLLGKYLQVPPQDLIFQYSPIGKPYITHPDDIRFNLSHSHDLALLAFGLKRDIGVDIEYHRRDLATKEIAERFFSPSEVTSLLSKPKALQIEAFYNCWTRKEAYLKAKGPGPPAVARTSHNIS